MFFIQVYRHVNHRGARQQLELLRHELEDRMRMAGGSPHLIEAQQAQVHQGDHVRGMRQRRHAADGKPGFGFHKPGVGPANALAVMAHQGFDFSLVDPPVARGDHQHGGVIRLAAKDDALGNLPQLDTQRIGRLLGCAGSVVEHDRQMRVASRLQHRSHALHAFGQWLKFGSTHKLNSLANTYS